ncbi:hypothetical protein M8818_000617 [Zalaria obscura]|uniref:Uncharacterized protein n=1 Tax=Zalaria obscura TaxID=2024903 RepID=A0ACC3SMQ0_9PEZI
MHINELPYEILSSILQQAASTNGQEGVKFTYGLGSNPLPLQSSKLSRYVRGPISPDVLRWDAACAVRQVCSQWHEWALDYAIKDVHLSRWRGAERWAELSTRRKMYNIYELIERPSGARVYRDPFGTLRQTASILARFPGISKHLRRLWFSGFYTPETDRLILDTLRSCRNLTSISIPWTLLRHGSADDWMYLLGIAGPSDSPLESLEIQAVCLMESQTSDTDFQQDLQPLRDPRISFQYLKRLKLFGNTTMMPVNDEDLTLIAGTIASLEEFHVTCLSTVSIEGVMAIVKASQSTLRASLRRDKGARNLDRPDV